MRARGIVSVCYLDRGYGFLVDQTGARIFLHVSDLAEEDRTVVKRSPCIMNTDIMLEFDEMQSNRGLQARNARIVK